MKNNVSLIYNLCLIVGDGLGLVAAFAGAYVIRVTISHRPLVAQVHAKTYISVFLVLLPFWILIFALLGLYNSNIYEKRFSEIGRLLIGSFIGMLFVVFWNFIATKPILPAREVPLLGLALGFLFLVIFRNGARFVRTTLFGYGIGITNVLIVGNTNMSDELVNSLADSKTSGYSVLGVVSSHQNKKYAHIHHFSSFTQALESIKSETLNGIIQTELYAEEAKNREILDYAQEHHTGYRFVPGNTELFVGNIDVELFRSSVPVIAVHQTALFGWGRIVKRVFDLVFGTIALIIALPFMLIIALLILIFDTGPILFRQKRLTRFDTTVKIFKFRTMKKEWSTGMSPEEAFEKMGRPELAKVYRASGDRLDKDPRITPLGRFLRLSSLDELPQLLNVIKGDISLVGPRALEPFELAWYSKKNLLLSVKSGLTGLAVVSGRSNLDFEERRKLDLYYVQNWSFWLDITILLKTFRTIVSRRGAR